MIAGFGESHAISFTNHRLVEPTDIDLVLHSFQSISTFLLSILCLDRYLLNISMIVYTNHPMKSNIKWNNIVAYLMWSKYSDPPPLMES